MPSQATPDLNRLFYPKTIAVVGATPKRGFVWSSGNAYINGCIKQSYRGKIFPVHPSAKTILGFKCYRNVRKIPEEIDLVIFCVPFSAALEVMEDCAERGVKFVHLLTAGFSETGRDDYADVEKQLVTTARNAGIRVVGPNCMGLYCPEGGLAWNGDLPDKIGTVGLFSQSGQLANMIVYMGIPQDVYFNKVVSFGNACDLQAHDFLNYMAQDQKTQILSAYIEGVTSGREFFEAAKKITREKPLVVWKGGQTEGGSRATQSHTAAMAGSFQLWESMCRQAGIISVNSIAEMVHTISALKRMSTPKGTRVAILGGAGGGSVTMTDIAEKEGLSVPHLSDNTIQRLEEFIPLQGSSAKNPLDILPHLRSKETFENLMALLKEDSKIDALIFALNLVWIYREMGRIGVNMYLRMMVKSKEWLEKPMFLVLEALQNVEMVSLHQEGEEWLVKHGVATFPSFEIAARILKYLKQYNDFLNND
ncbi:MAG: CoA-binding protein [Deltaproteobacteria bacterium]|nr:CoA-binding protein [Deltaproteobacteria bacterium]